MPALTGVLVSISFFAVGGTVVMVLRRFIRRVTFDYPGKPKNVKSKQEKKLAISCLSWGSPICISTVADVQRCPPANVYQEQRVAPLTADQAQCRTLHMEYEGNAAAPKGPCIWAALVHPQGRARDDDQSSYLFIVSHGKGHDLEDDCEKQRSKIFSDLGASVLVYDYSGFGASDGCSSEASCCSNLRAVLYYAEHHLHWNRNRIVLVGQSLGTGPTFELLSSGVADGVAGAVFIHPYRTIISTRIKLSPMLSMLLYRMGLDIFCSERCVDRVKSFPNRVLVLHGDKDKVVPYHHGEWLSERLESNGQLFKFATLKGGAHADIFKTHTGRLSEELGSFLKALQSSQL